MNNNWWILDGVLYKNPSDEQIRSTGKCAKTRLDVSSDDDIVIEGWYIGNPDDNLLIDFSYSLSEVNRISPEILKAEKLYTGLQLSRRTFFEHHGIDPDSCRWLRRVAMPKSWFTENGVYLHGYC